jgi:hypothetical protein
MLTSPIDDFSQHTLKAVSGTLGKLQYVVGLRQGNGEYFHWGMARSHGEASANLAIAQAHTNVFLTVLRTPIRALWEEARTLALDQRDELRDFIARLQQRSESLIPKELQGGTRRHFNSVLLALCSLAGVPAGKTGRGA